jgi:hypothetical protein
MSDLKKVAVPIAESRRGLNGCGLVGLFEPREQLACAAHNDH